jgi:predicted polyphosphate/ATP-dependent NAD kinase
MSKIGFIANPASGKDIRRLVSHATVVSRTGKTDIIKRAILGADSVGVDEILIMPDYSGLGISALESLTHHSVSCRMGLMDFEIQGDQEDSILAAQMMQEEKVDCIITLGGDGTNRVVSKSCGQIPLVAISSGTNNVFPVMTEGTTAGIAAGLLARKIVADEEVTTTMKKIRFLAEGVEKDIALIDAVVVTNSFIGARAIWDVDEIQQIFLTRAEPGAIGISSIGAALRPVDCRDPFGLRIELGPGGEKVKAPVAPGLIMDVNVKNCQILEPDEKVPISFAPSIIALDGEREFEIYGSHSFHLALGMDGPRLVDISRTIRLAADKGFFRTRKKMGL